jgi:hypothetical protein
MAGKTFYASYRGSVYLGLRDDNGNPIRVRPIGDAVDVKLSANVDTEEVTEGESGQDLTAVRLRKAKKVNISLNARSHAPELWAIALYGTVDAQGTGTVTSELLPPGVVAGELLLLAHQNVSSVVVKDSAATPVVVAPAKYAVNGAPGSILINDVAGYTQPFRGDYAYAAAQRVGLFSALAVDRWFHFEGVNTVDGSAIYCNLYRVNFDPAKEYALSTTGVSGFQLDGSALFDSSKPINNVLGQFGWVGKL